MITKVSLGEAIREYREKRGKTQEEAAAGARTSVHTWRSWEQGRAEPGSIRFSKIAAVLDVDPNQILVRADELGSVVS